MDCTVSNVQDSNRFTTLLIPTNLLFKRIELNKANYAVYGYQLVALKTV